MTPGGPKELEVFEIPRYVVFGPRSIERAPEIIAKLGLGGLRGLILTGPRFSNRFVDYLQCRVCQVEVLGQDFSAEDLVQLARRYVGKVDYVVGLGGGRVIDFSKAMAHLLNRHYVSIPTVASHDGFASPMVSHLLQMDLDRLGLGKVKKSPIAIIADTSIILEAPRRYLLAGVGELVGKLIAVKDWKLASRLKGEDYSEYAATLALDSAAMVLRNEERLRVHGEEAVRLVVKALIGCGVAMAIANSSRPCSGSEHLFSHALDILAKQRGLATALHGEQVAVGTILMAYLHGLRWRRIRDFLARLGIPTTAKELGIDRELIVEALTMAHEIRRDRYTILGTDGLSRKAAEALVERTGVA